MPKKLPVLAVVRSGNEKIANRDRGEWVATTYAPIEQSCPKTCAQHPDNGGGCYFSSNHRLRPINARLQAAAAGLDARDVARAEGRAIRALRPRGPHHLLRVHTGGDCRTASAAREVAAGVDAWHDKGGGAAWTYSHAWQRIPIASWGKISVLASVDDTVDAPAALAAGYAPAVVVDRFTSDRAWVDARGVRWVPCPAQTREDVSCASCGLCTRSPALAAARTGVAFAAHGTAKKRAAAAAGCKLKN